MSTDIQSLRSESFFEIAQIIQRDINILLEEWTHRAVQEQPNARRIHHHALLDHFRELLLSLAQSLLETDSAKTIGHYDTAKVHGIQRWEVGWSLQEVVRDYQILQLVILKYLDEVLDRPLSYREGMAIGLVIDEAIASSVAAYVAHRDEHMRQLEEKRAELHRQVHEQLRNQAEALRESDRRKNEFLATLAHELRNPLAPLGNALAVLYVRPPTDPAHLQVREIFDRQIRQMTRLLDDLLDVSRIAQGKIVLRKEWVSLAAAAAQVAQMTESLLKSRQLHFELNVPKEELWVEADPARLNQVLVNLLNNAAKYTDRGGRVWLTIERKDSEAMLRVRDTGVGIAPEFLPHIFDLFTQAEWPVERSQGGLGIGLSLVRRLVELHGGTITASSAGPGRGSEFVVRLPALAAEEGRREKGREAIVGTGVSAGRRILVVEDNADAADSLALLLRMQGHEVQVAYDGPTALQTAQTFRPDVMIVDIGLPHMDGYEVARRVRVFYPNVLLWAMTGYGRDQDRQRSADAGFHAHLVKPVDPEALQRLLTQTAKPADSAKGP